MQSRLPVSPGAIIGYRKNGQPIRVIAGGSETVPEAPPQPPAPAPAAPPPAPAQPPVPAAPPAPAPAAGTGQPDLAGSVEQLPGWAQKIITDARKDAGDYRTKLREAEAKVTTDVEAAKTAAAAEVTAIKEAAARALGLAPEEVTPEQIAAQRDAERQRADEQASAARTAAVELAVYRAAQTAGADGNKLLDSRSFADSIAGLDPAAADFGQRVSAAITTATTAHPEWKTAPVPPPVDPSVPPVPQPPPVPRSGAEFGQAPPGERMWTPEDEARATPNEVVEAMDKGLLPGFGAKRRDRRFGT